MINFGWDSKAWLLRSLMSVGKGSKQTKCDSLKVTCEYLGWVV